MNNSIWIFHGTGGKFTSGVFESKDDAETLIKKYKLSGILSKYPIGFLIYDWACENEFFKPKKEEQYSSDFIQKFSSASQEHYHYENGKKE